jgi:hypothetical protein
MPDVNMSTRKNHYVPQWYQRLFSRDAKSGLVYKDMTPDHVPPASAAKTVGWKRHSAKYCFWLEDLYTTTVFGTPNDDIERLLFGEVDNDGAAAVRALVNGNPREMLGAFKKLFAYLDAQKLRTPKGLDWIKSNYSGLDQQALMDEMQRLRQMHITMWVEAVREVVSAENSDVKFIVTDHPVTIYNPECPPGSDLCHYPNDPDIALKGSQTLFPLGPNHCLILTNLEYADNPDRADLLTPRTNARRFGTTLVHAGKWIRTRNLNAAEVTAINHILKSMARRYVAADVEEWLSPEATAPKDWRECGKVLLPPRNELYPFKGEIYVGHRDGTSSYSDAFGRTSKIHEMLRKAPPNKEPGAVDPCPCGSGKAYGICCQGLPQESRMPWDVYSIRERNLMHLNAVYKILGMDKAKSWEDVRRDLSDKQVADIHTTFAALWPKDTNLADLLPRPDSRVFRAVYIGTVDPRTLPTHVMAWLSYFDEIILPSPFMHPEDVRPEYSPVDSPGQHKQQTIMNVAVLDALAPFIRAGRVHLIPDPLDFNLFLRDSFWRIAKEKRGKVELDPSDLAVGREFGRDSFRRAMLSLPDDDLREQFRRADPSLTPEMLERMVVEAREQQAEDPLALLQPLEGGENGGQLLQMRSTGFELGLFVAQLTGAAIYSDLRHTETELVKARNPPVAEGAQPFEYTMSISLPMFQTLGASLKNIERHAEVRAKMRDLWQASVAQPTAADAEAVSSAMDEVARIIGETKTPEDSQDLVMVFEPLMKFSIPPNGYGLREVHRFLIAFGRRKRLESVPLSIIFGRSLEQKLEPVAESEQ